MKKRLTALFGCLAVLALGVVAQAEEVPNPHPQQIRFTSDGTKLIVTYDELHQNQRINAVQTWDVASGQMVAQVVQPELNTTQRSFTEFSTAGKLFCYTKDQEKQRTVIVAETASGKVVSTLETPLQTVTPQAFSADGKLLAGRIEKTGKFGLWETATGKPSTLLAKDTPHRSPADDLLSGIGPEDASPEEFLNFHFSRDNRLIVRIGRNRKFSPEQGQWIVVNDRHTGKRLNAFSIEGADFESNFLLGPKGQHIIHIPFGYSTAKRPLQMSVWSTQTGQKLQSISLQPHSLRVGALIITAAGNKLISLCSYIPDQEPINISLQRYRRLTWSADTGELLEDMESPIKVPSPYHAPNLPTTSPDGRLIARATDRQVIEILDFESGKIEKEIKMELRF